MVARAAPREQEELLKDALSRTVKTPRVQRETVERLALRDREPKIGSRPITSAASVRGAMSVLPGFYCLQDQDLQARHPRSADLKESRKTDANRKKMRGFRVGGDSSSPVLSSRHVICKPGAERCFPDPDRHNYEDIGNPDSRIPDKIPERLKDGTTISMIGNPDIRVPDVIGNED
ncbi:hypothetical protein NDU88_002284 [Pleurodeles waltl]|uniref:Uncharacterized protein n=1 Tax=Pleurodeles waltl TaxID=8319 RepID=A0AAV7WPR6_PLEWA|nr:hypothetical protein NDU88_002284 [Pleurodeles waltl]